MKNQERKVGLVVLGSGPGGYSAAFRAADSGMKDVVIVERHKTMGGVCLNVGCIPSKALLHMAELYYDMQGVSAHGLMTESIRWDIDKARSWKDKIIGQLTQGLAAMAKMRGVSIMQGEAEFLSPNTMKVGDEILHFEQAIIAAGSESVTLPFIPEDERIFDSTGALELKDVKSHLVVLGGGIIGCEMATVYRAMGCPVTIIEMQDQLMPGTDKDLVAPMQKMLVARGIDVKLKTQISEVKAGKKNIQLTSANGDVIECGQILVAIGRRPNGHNIGADKAGVHIDERGFIPVDESMRTNVEHIFAIGDICSEPMLAHNAVHEGHVAAQVAVGEYARYLPKCIPSVAYTDPEVAWVGVTETEAKAQGLEIKTGVFPWMASGRALCLDRSEGMTKIISDAKTGQVIGGGIVGRLAGELIGEVCLAVEMGCDVEDVAMTIHPHPTLCESVGLSAEALLGHCTDLPPKKKK